MPVHDWTRVEAGVFHSFHLGWIGEICRVLNEGLLPEAYYALAEQHAGRSIPDLLALHEHSRSLDSLRKLPGSGGTAVAEAPPKVRRRQTVELAALLRRRSIAIRQVSGHRLVALIEILSPANKDRQTHVEDFAAKVVDALRSGVHVLLVDLFPPSRHDPHGIHGVILQMMEDSAAPYDLPAEEPLTLASYVADTTIDIYLEHLAPGSSLTEMPLFLDPDSYVATPLELSYAGAYRGVPLFYRELLEGRQSQS